MAGFHSFQSSSVNPINLASRNFEADGHGTSHRAIDSVKAYRCERTWTCSRKHRLMRRRHFGSPDHASSRIIMLLNAEEALLRKSRPDCDDERFGLIRTALGVLRRSISQKLLRQVGAVDVKVRLRLTALPCSWLSELPKISQLTNRSALRETRADA